MKRVIIIVGIVLFPFVIKAQGPEGSYNPYLNQGIISPSEETIGKGTISFNIGNTGSDPLVTYMDEKLVVTINLSDGEPDHSDPILAISGTSASLFSWTYNNGTYTGTQNSSISASSAGNIVISYKESENPDPESYTGFSASVTATSYQQLSNTENDDAVSSYTYISSRDFGDAPASYGTANHRLDSKNYLGDSYDADISDRSSENADGDDLTGVDDEDGVSIPIEIFPGDTIDLPVEVTGVGFLNAWLDWNGDGDFEDLGEQIADNILRYEGTKDLRVIVPLDAIVTAPTFARFRLSPNLLVSSSGSAPGGEVEDYKIIISPSSDIPTAPTGLSINSYSDDFVSISWEPSMDNFGISEYMIYRDGIQLGSTGNLEYTDITVSVENLYSYAVSAVNVAGNESVWSSVLAVYVDDRTPPTTPNGFNISSVQASGVYLLWEASQDNVAVSAYKVYRSGILLATTADLSYYDKDVSVSKSYTYTVSAIDAAGNESDMTALFAVFVEDILPPSVPAGLEVVSVSEDEITIGWEASSDDVGVSDYRVYRLGSFLNTVSDLTYTDNTVLMGETYTYTVSALDASGNESGLSDMVTVTANATSVRLSATGDLSIYPNPSDGEFVIDFRESGRFTLEIVASSGVMVYQNTIDMYGYSLPLSLGYFETGVYFVRIFNSDKNYIGKLMIVK